MTIKSLEWIKVINGELDMDQWALLSANPVTVAWMMGLIKKQKFNSIINTGASSTLGRIFSKLAKKNNVNIINIVRKKENV